MQRRFADIMKELRGLINEWSAPCCSSEDLAGPDSARGGAVLLAVSGGIDSMCLAELFASLDEPFPFALAHCNFNLRAEESDGDEAFVKGWASDHGVECHTVSFDTEAFAQTRGISIEMAARELRYTWFGSLCRQYGYAAVAVAHNANDNAETLMLNLLRGSGMNGLSGMSRCSVVPGSKNIPLIRPLLDFTRKQIEGYMFAGGHQYREDSTNALSDYKRNRIRNEVFPVFGKMNPSFIRTFNREMGYFAEAAEIVDDWCREAAASVVKDNRIDLKALMSNKHWKYLLYHILEGYGFNTSTLASVENLLESSRTVSGKRFDSPEYMLLTGRDELIVLPSDRENAGSDNEPVSVEGEGEFEAGGRRFRVEVLPYNEGMDLKTPEGVIMLDAGKLRFPFVLRRWKMGDWIIPFGMRGRKKLSDLFADLKYDRIRKEAAVVVEDTSAPRMADGQHIAALACVRIDNHYRISDSTESIVRISEIS